MMGFMAVVWEDSGVLFVLSTLPCYVHSVLVQRSCNPSYNPSSIKISDKLSDGHI